MAEKILIVDDSQTQLDVLKMRLLKEGFEAETAHDGVEGYQKVFEFAPDVILSDIMMPNLDGYEFCRLLKNNPKTDKIPVILLTALDKQIDKFWAHKSGAERFVSKTSDFESLKKNFMELIIKHPITKDYKAQLLAEDVSETDLQTRLNKILNELLKQSAVLNEFHNLREYTTHEKLLAQKMFELLGSFVEYDLAGIFFKNPDSNEKNILYFDAGKAMISNFVIEKVKRDFFAQMKDLKPFSVTNFSHETIFESTSDSERIISATEFKTGFILPLEFEEKPLGGICFYSKNEIKYSDFQFFKMMKTELMELFRAKYLYSKTEFLSVTDGLTGLYNRRHFDQNVEREFMRTKRYPRDLSLAIADIDFFKKVNDTYGHQYGDYVLKEVSKIFVQSFRKTDMIYRYGGEELTIILTETSLENSLIPLERLRQKIENYDFSHDGISAKVTISMGVSTNFQDFKTSKEMVESADKALYRAKQTGRNKVIAYSHEQFANI